MPSPKFKSCHFAIGEVLMSLAEFCAQPCHVLAISWNPPIDCRHSTLLMSLFRCLVACQN